MCIRDRYLVEAELLKDGNVLDSWSGRIGLRTMSVHREKDEYGEQFAHEVNGVRIFAMGADYIPCLLYTSLLHPVFCGGDYLYNRRLSI